MIFANDAAVTPPAPADSGHEEPAGVAGSTSGIGGASTEAGASPEAGTSAAAGVNSQTEQDSYVYLPLRNQIRTFSQHLFALAEIVEPDVTFVAQDEETLAVWAFILGVVRQSRDEGKPVTRSAATRLVQEIRDAFRVEWTRRDILVREMYGLVFRYEYAMMLNLMVEQKYVDSAFHLDFGRGAILNKAQATNPNIRTHRMRLNGYTGGKGCSPVRLFGFTFATLDNRDPSKSPSGSMFNTPDRESPLRAAIPETGRRIYLDGSAGNGKGCTPPENAVEIDLSQAVTARDEARSSSFVSRLQNYQILLDLIAQHGSNADLYSFLKPPPRKRKKTMKKASHDPEYAIQPAYHYKFITHMIRMNRGKVDDTDADPGAFRGRVKHDYHFAICQIVPRLGYVRYKIPRSGAAAHSAVGLTCRSCNKDDCTSNHRTCAMCIYVKDPSKVEKLKDAHGCDVVYKSVSEFARVHKRECIGKYSLGCKSANSNGYLTCFVHDGARFGRLDNVRIVDPEKQYGNSQEAGRTHSMSMKTKKRRKKKRRVAPPSPAAENGVDAATISPGSLENGPERVQNSEV